MLQSSWDLRCQLPSAGRNACIKLKTNRVGMGLRNLETESLYLDVMEYMDEFKVD